MEAIEWAQTSCSDILIIDQFEMQNESEKISSLLCNYLGMAEKTREVKQFFSESDIQRTSQYQTSRSLSLGELDWTAEEKEQFRRIAGPTMQRMGYPM